MYVAQIFHCCTWAIFFHSKQIWPRIFFFLEILQDLFQMGASSYPGMTQPFSMGHTSNMSSVGVRQDSMGKLDRERERGKKKIRTIHLHFPSLIWIQACQPRTNGTTKAYQLYEWIHRIIRISQRRCYNIKHKSDVGLKNKQCLCSSMSSPTSLIQVANKCNNQRFLIHET